MGRRIEGPYSPRRALYVGSGLVYGGLWQQGYSSQLEFFDWGIRLQGGPISKRLGSFYEFRYEELAEARLARMMYWLVTLRGIRFSTKIPPQPPLFLTVDFREILERLERLGVPVDRNPT